MNGNLGDRPTAAITEVDPWRDGRRPLLAVDGKRRSRCSQPRSRSGDMPWNATTILKSTTSLEEPDQSLNPTKPEETRVSSPIWKPAARHVPAQLRVHV